MIDVTRGAGRRRTGEDNGEGRTRANSMDMIDLGKLTHDPLNNCRVKSNYIL